MASENDFRDAEFCKKLIDRAIFERNSEAIRGLLNRISSVFVFSTDEFRKEIVDFAYLELRSWSFKEMLEIGKESILGNVLVLTYALKKIVVITTEKIAVLADLLQLVHIEDPLTFEYVPTEGRLVLDVNESVGSSKTSTIEKAIEACELLFSNGKLEKSRDTVSAMRFLYENSRRTEHKFKGRVVASLLEKRLDLFLGLLKKIYRGIDDENQLKACYTDVYDLLSNAAVPVFFEPSRFKSEFNKFYNDNFFFALVLDKSGNEHLLMPFEEIETVEVQKVFDPESTRAFVTPTGRIGKIMVREVYSFRRIREISDITKEQLEVTKQMSENEIGKRIRQVLQDQNITAHSPAEKADIYLHKLLINNENDLRDVAVMIKGKGYPKITLSDIASNLVKAVDLPVQVVFLVYTGILLDEPREKFTHQCERAKKMHCIIDPVDLTKLFVAYNNG